MEARITVEQVGQNTRIKCILPVAVYRKRHGWSAFSPHVKTLGYSMVSPEEALKDFEVNLDVFFTVQAHFDILDRTLHNLGWTKTDHTYAGRRQPFREDVVGVHQLQEVKHTFEAAIGA